MTTIEHAIWDFSVQDLLRTVDGDTYDLRLAKRFDKGFNVHEDFTYAARFRLYGIDIVEHNQAGGSSATSFAEGWISAALRDDVLRGVTYKSEGLVPDGGFGRWLIDLYRTDTSEHLNLAMKAAGYMKADSKWNFV